MTERRTGNQQATAGRENSSAVMTDLRWLERYANHSGFHTGDTNSMLLALRQAFGAAAWRIVCRSPKEAFIPILRNQELSIHSLIAYCKSLVERSFVQAPKLILLAYYVSQRRLYFNRPCRIPQGKDYDLIRVANRHELLRLRDIACVANWVHQSRSCILPRHKWSTLVMRARKYNERERVHLLSARHHPWHFFCHSITWRGYEVQPLTDASGLWEEGQRHGTCLYQLRYDCTSFKPSRFLRITKDGSSIATLELAWRPPEPGFKGMDLVWGRWEMQDLRLSFNRLPDDRLVHAMQAFAEQYNCWAKRIRRMPSGYIQETVERIDRAKRMSVWDVFSPEQEPG